MPASPGRGIRLSADAVRYRQLDDHDRRQAAEEKDTSLNVGVDVTVTTPNHDAWKFTTTYKPEVEFPQMDHHIVGIRYFETNSLLFDLEAEEIGFQIGN